MYQKRIISEELSVIDVEEVKLYLRQLNATPEDAMIEQQTRAAIVLAEEMCNRAFTAKVVEIKTDLRLTYLFGELDEVTSVTVDSEPTTNFTITGTVEPKFEGNQTGNYTITYTTAAKLPLPVKEWVMQTVARMYERNGKEAITPNDNLLNPYKNLVWLV